MLDAQRIRTEFIGLIGWRQNPDSEGWQLTDMLTSESGLFYQGVSPLLTVENLMSVAPEFDIMEDSSAARDAAFTSWLKGKTEDAILEAMQIWYSTKLNLGTATNLLERNQLFREVGSDTATRSNRRFTGLQVYCPGQKGLVQSITEIGLQFSENQTIQVTVWKAGGTTHEYQQSINYTADGGVQWVTVDWKLKGGCTYYIGYDEDAINGHAIDGVGVGRADNYFYVGKAKSRTAAVRAFSLNTGDDEKVIEQDLVFACGTNYGLNFRFHVGCDYTDFVVEQKRVFSRICYLNVGATLLREIALNPNSRVNRNQANVSRAELMYELDGDTQGRDSFSIGGKFAQALGAVQFDRTNIDKYCLPCRKKSVRYRSIGPSQR